MKQVKIYLRSIEQDGQQRLSLFDTNRDGGFDDLVTEVEGGTTIIWALDKDSGISAVNSVESKNPKGDFIDFNPKKRIFCKGFKFCVPRVKEAGEIKYDIKYTPSGSKELLSIDPTIKIKPPN